MMATTATSARPAIVLCGTIGVSTRGSAAAAAARVVVRAAFASPCQS